MAKLTVDRNGVWLGKIRVAQWIFAGAATVIGYRIDGVFRYEDPRYDNADDAKRDAESEVRRLLKDAGVDCE